MPAIGKSFHCLSNQQRIHLHRSPVISHSENVPTLPRSCVISCLGPHLLPRSCVISCLGPHLRLNVSQLQTLLSNDKSLSFVFKYCVILNHAAALSYLLTLCNAHLQLNLHSDLQLIAPTEEEGLGFLLLWARQFFKCIVISLQSLII